MTLTLQATGAVTDISAADVVIGSDSVPFTFVYSDEWLAAMSSVTIPASVGFYPNDWLVGGVSPTIGVGRSIELGTITLQMTGLMLGEYGIFVDSNLDGISGIARGLPGQEFVSEPLIGSALVIYGVPEPGSAALLLAGVIGFLYRIRSKKHLGTIQPACAWRTVAFGIACLTGASVDAGVVTFSPPSQTVQPGEVVRMELTAYATGIVTNIHGLDVSIWPHSRLSFDFAYSNEFIAAMENVSEPYWDYNFWPILYLSGNNPARGAGPALVIGNATVETVGLSPGTYSFEVGEPSELVDVLPGPRVVSEPLSGIGTFTIVPEPGCLTLLVVGVLAVVGRRESDTSAVGV